MVRSRDGTAMCDDDRLADGEADTDARILGREKAVEDAVKILVGNARPVSWIEKATPPSSSRFVRSSIRGRALPPDRREQHRDRRDCDRARYADAQRQWLDRKRKNAKAPPASRAGRN